jgi:putative ABC transport system permease protein
MLNVKERYEEIGIMRAIGYKSGQIISLFLGRSIMLGLLGAPLGFLLGGYLSLEFGPSIFSLTAGSMKLNPFWLYWLLILTPTFTAVAAFIPTVSAVSWDPVRTLKAS